VAFLEVGAAEESKSLDLSRTNLKIWPPFSLRFVDIMQVMPHEQVDPQRVAKLKQRLQTEGILMDPPMVMQAENYYIVLDGATRLTALKELGYPHLVVQVISAAEVMGLHTWNHALCNIAPDHLIELLGQLAEIELVATTADHVLTHNDLCYLQTVAGVCFLLRPKVRQNWLVALNKLTESYIQASQVQRTIERDLLTLHDEFPTLAALIIFPEFTVKQVLQVAQSAHFFPAGITRFIIHGRVLRLNVDLAVLKSSQTLVEKNHWLHDFLVQKLNLGKIRYYEEPIYLLDG